MPKSVDDLLAEARAKLDRLDPREAHAAWERVVVVVPRLAERRQREPEDVGRVVVGIEPAAAEEVAHRVHAPGDVVDHEDPHEAAPQKRGQAAGDAAAQPEPEGERNRQAEQYEPWESARDAPHASVLEQVAREAPL